MGSSREDLNKQFIEAVSSDSWDLVALEALLEKGAEAHTLLADGSFALERALQKGKITQVSLLLRYQDPSKKNQKGKTALELFFEEKIAITRQKDEQVSREVFAVPDFEGERIIDNLLLTEGKFDLIPLDVLGKLFVPLLELSAGLRRMQIVSRSLARNANPNHAFRLTTTYDSQYEYTALHYLAGQEKSANSIKRLLDVGEDAGEDANVALTKSYKRAIERAAGLGRWENVLIFIQHAKSPISPADLGEAFAAACKIKDEVLRNNIITEFLKIGVSLPESYTSTRLSDFPKNGDQQEKNNFAIVHYIDQLTGKGYWSSILLLLPILSPSVLKQFFGSQLGKMKLGSVFSSALLAATPESLQVAKALLDIGVSVNEHVLMQDKKYTYPMFIAARKGDRKLLEDLMEAGADPQNAEFGGDDFRYAPSKSVFQVLGENNAWDFIPRLINLRLKKIDPRILSEVVWDAIKSKNVAAKTIIEPLLVAGADPNVDYAFDSMLDFAVKNKDKDLVELLLRFKARPSNRFENKLEGLQELGGDVLVAVYAEAQKAKTEAQRLDEEKKLANANRILAESKEAKAQARAAKEKPAEKAQEIEKNASLQPKNPVAVLAPNPLKPKEGAVAAAASVKRPDPSLMLFPRQPEKAPQPDVGRQQFLADFKKINETYLQDNFLANKKALVPWALIAAISAERDNHPHGLVAIAESLAKKYPGACDATNDDFLVDLRLEKFKHERLWVVFKFWKWGKHTVVHKSEDNKQAFYRSSSFEKYVQTLPYEEKSQIADEMRRVALDDENKTRSASIARVTKK
jgi:ankyrin repeat protein